jgi:Rrf2 family nitric oxide-sensitive transcriptional repressor
MRITKRTNIAFRILMFCGVNGDRLVTKSEIAERCRTSESHLAQVINRLAQMGYLHTQRGRAGGIALSRPMDEIDVGDVFRRLEVRTEAPACVADVDNTCPLVAGCRLRLALTDAMEAFHARLDGMTLADLICGNHVLFDLIAAPACPERA